MKRGLLTIGVFSAVICTHRVPCQETASRHLVIGFEDQGPPAIHSVQARTSDAPDAIWSSVPANISLSQDGLRYEATVEMPDARWGTFRVKREGGDQVSPVTALQVELRPASGALFAVDVSYANQVGNREFSQTWRFGGLIPGIHFRLGQVVLGFRPYVTNQEAAAFFEAGGLGFELSFPTIFHVECVVISGDISDHVRRLKESGIVLRAEPMPWSSPQRIAVVSGANTSIEEMDELISSIEGLEADWATFLQAEKIGLVYVPEGHEFAWILVLERHPMINYAEPSYIYHLQ